MKTEWNDEKIGQEIRKMAVVQPHPAVWNRVWVKVEERLPASTHRMGGHWIWRPWGHPVRWVGLAAGLCLILTGVQSHINNTEKDEMGSYLLQISNPTDSMANDQDSVKVSALLSEPAALTPEMADEVHIDSLASDEIFL